MKINKIPLRIVTNVISKYRNPWNYIIVLNNEKSLSKEEKINFIEKEISKIKKRSLSQGKVLSFLIEDELFQMEAFKNCKVKNKIKKLLISSSGEVSPFQFDCVVSDKIWSFYMDVSGKVKVYEKK